jgi:hypothetical protein
MSTDRAPLTDDELAAEAVQALPDKEVASILDLNADLDLALDAAAPIDLAVGANANVAAPIDAAVGANVLSDGSSAQALSDQGALIDQGIVGDATAAATQDSVMDQGGAADDAAGATDGSTEASGGATAVPGTVTDGTDLSSALDGDILNVDVNLTADADLASPINGAVAANANVAAPIDAAVAANIATIDSEAVAVSQQDAIITQSIDGDASAVSDQQSDIQQ